TYRPRRGRTQDYQPYLNRIARLVRPRNYQRTTHTTFALKAPVWAHESTPTQLLKRAVIPPEADII
ncbi:MAG: hypothetical protein K2K76_04995, partial [Muribaculaceae bacterium]|nr:hypothetical protein [Muribaculaceae bacterium]